MSFEKQRCHMEFLKDESGKEMLLKDGQFQVMMEWEKPYMQACISALNPSGDVLEIGFGCGYSAEAIQSFKPKSHTIIEYHPMIAQKAREWAKSYTGVVVIEDTWQQALGSLGKFDAIFFDDYPLESFSTQEKKIQEKEKASLIVKKGRDLIQKIKEKFSFLEKIEYKDEDLEEFFTEIKKRKTVHQDHFLPFFFKLCEKNQITKDQLTRCLERLLREGLIDEKTKINFLKKNAQKTQTYNSRGDRFYEFFFKCYHNHLNTNGRFSCYLEHSNSRYEDERFLNEIILNPELDFQEHFINVDVPKNCKYFEGSQACVIVITNKKA